MFWILIQIETFQEYGTGFIFWIIKFPQIIISSEHLQSQFKETQNDFPTKNYILLLSWETRSWVKLNKIRKATQCDKVGQSVCSLRIEKY